MKQFGRQIKLYLGNQYESIEVGQLRIRFEICKTITAEPNPAKIGIFNLNESNRNSILTKYYNKAVLSVGYEDMRVIYAGDIVQSEVFKKGGDTIVELECGDGAKDITFARVNTTLAAGANDSTILNESLKTMTGTNQGIIALPNSRTLPRGRVLVGNARDILDKIAINNDANWSVQDGTLVMLPADNVLADNEGYVLSKDTGMIGSPERTNNGLKITCLLNPNLKIGGLVRVESILKQFNGDYKITELTHKGDYLSDEWHTEIICIGGEFQKVSHAK